VRYVHSEECPDIGPICEVRNEPPQQHDQRFTIADARLTGAYGITDRVAIEAELPGRYMRQSVKYLRMDGTEFTPDYPTIHHRNETLIGPTDPIVRALISWAPGALVIAVRAGVTIPAGSTVPDPDELGGQGIAHEHVQFGTGTFDPAVGVSLSGTAGTVALRAFFSTQTALYENRYGYRAGTRTTAGFSAATFIWRELGGSLGAELATEAPERWHGHVHSEGNIGRTDWLGDLSLGHPIGPVQVTAGVQIPFYHTAVGAQLEYPAVLRLSFTY